MSVIVGRTSASSQPSSSIEPLLDLLVEDGAAEHARPARVRAPLLEVLGDRVDDLAVEVEAEVVAGGEVGEPLVADADHAAVDLVDDGVRHRVRPLELGQLAAGSEPAVDPPVGDATGTAGRPGVEQRSCAQHRQICMRL